MIGVHPRALLEFDSSRAELKDAIAQQIAGYADPVELLCRQARRGHRADRRRIRAGAGDRAPVRLQVERIREPHRRQKLRAARGEPDARLPRRVALHRPELPALLRARVPGPASACATRWASTTCRSWCRSCARSPRPRRSPRCSADNGLKRGVERPQAHHDVRAADQRRCSPTATSITSTACRSARTT